MRRFLATAAATAALVGIGITAGSAAPPVAVAKSCSSGSTHAVIRGSEKCLRRGQYCSRGADRTYHRYGFHCHKRDRRGSYHLT